MATEQQDDGFYPYRIQEAAGNAHVPVVDVPTHLEDAPIHKDVPLADTPPQPPGKKSFPYFTIILVAILLFGIFVFIYNTRARERQQTAVNTSISPSLPPSPSATPTPPLRTVQFPDGTLQSAYDNTIYATTMRAGFISEVVTTITNQDATNQTINTRAEGYLFGAADGSTIQTELRVTDIPNPSLSAFYGQILVDNRLFMKLNNDNWIERDRSDYNKLYENQPIDATAYSYNMLDTLFTQSKALLRGVNEGTIKAESDEQIDGKNVKVFSFALSIPEYINALKSDPKTTDFTLEDAQKILRDATITGKLYVDPEKNYIVRIQLTGTRLTQISSEQSAQLGITTMHDMTMTANLLDFNTPLSLAPPQQ